LPKRRTTDLGQLSARLGHDFANPALLKRALTHASARLNKPIEDNEQLEFLGDRVLGLAVAELLIESYPQASEGELARWYNNLVRAETCADIAQQWGLGSFITTGGKVSGARILGDACEAILGAIFVDKGYEAAKGVVKRFWEPHFEERELASLSAKSELQEWAQRQGLPLPRYIEIGREGPDHAPHFIAEVQVEGLTPERGQGANKRQAEQAAALAMLLREGVWRPPADG
jgi:ribonuclease-3